MCRSHQRYSMQKFERDLDRLDQGTIMQGKLIAVAYTLRSY